MSEQKMEISQSDISKFPYRYLLRWSWPDHIESLIRRMMWSWLSEVQETEVSETPQAISKADFLAMRVMWLIAVHPDSPGAMLEIISEQCAYLFLERVAENPGTWPSTLRKLSKHASPRVRGAVGQNKNTPSDVLFELAHDESVDVRYSMAEGAQGDTQLLHHLLEDDNVYVVSRAKRTLVRLFPPATAMMPIRRTSIEKQDLKRVAEG